VLCVEAVHESHPSVMDEGDLDASLVRRVSEGSAEALASLYDRHAPTVYAAAVRVGRDRTIAAEVVQDTFLALWNRADLFDPVRGSLRAWLLTIARNRAIDDIRASNRRGRPLPFSSFDREGDDGLTTVEWLAASGRPLALATPETGPEMAASDMETRAVIADAVASLEPFERIVIQLAYGEGLSQNEIATRLGWPIGTVKTRTRRALGRLRGAIEDQRV
jgi:RNA polymerase sigma-70 factor, ECF subfamily